MTTTIGHSLAKTAALVAAIALVASSFAFVPSAKAQTATPSQIAALQAQIAALQAQLAALQGGSTVSYAFARDLTIGATGADVTALQNWLISRGYTIPAGATGYFGTQTRAAVAAYQAANGITPAAGYFGPITRARVNATVTPPTQPPPTGGGLQGGAGSVDNYDIMADYRNEEVGEGQRDAEVGGLEIEVSNGSDIELTAVRLEFTKADSSNRDFRRYADEVTIWLDGDEVASVDARDFTRSGSTYSRTVSLDSGAIIRRGDVGELVVAVSAVTNLDSADEGDEWDLDFTSVRFRDAQGATISEDPGTSSVRFSFEDFASASGVELRLSDGDADVNDPRTITLNRTTRRDNVEILSFELEVRGSSDIWLDEVPVEFASNETNLTTLASGVYLYMDGRRVGSENVPGSGRDVVFDDLDLDLDAGDTYEFTVVVDLRALSSAGVSEGDTLGASVRASDLVAEDENGNAISGSSRLRGSATGGPHALYAEGISARVIGSPNTIVTAQDGANNDTVQFVWVVDITAGDADVYINADTADVVTTGNANDVDTIYSQERSGGTALSGLTGTITTSSSSSNVTQGVMGGTGYGGVYNGEQFFRIRAGRTAQFTITVSGVNSADSKQVRALLENIEWTTDDVTSSGGTSATINSYTFNLGTQAATPYRFID